MKTLILRQYGHFLSGRSLPREIIANFQFSGDLTIDFSGIMACNQAFVNELFQRIEVQEIELSSVKFVGLDTPNVKNIVETERMRFIQITKSKENL